MKKLIRSVFMIAVIVIIVYFFWNKLQQEKDVEITHKTVSVVTKLKNIKKLETTQMTITKLIEAEENLNDLIPGIGLDDKLQELFFKDKIGLEVEGVITAGFDMEKLGTGAVTIDKNGAVTISLPPAEILHTKLTENTKPFERQLGILTKGNVDMETEIRNTAKTMLREDAIKAGILMNAEKGATQTLKDLFESAGVVIKEVIVEREID